MNTFIKTGKEKMALEWALAYVLENAFYTLEELQQYHDKATAKELWEADLELKMDISKLLGRLQ